MEKMILKKTKNSKRPVHPWTTINMKGSKLKMK